MDRKLLPSVVAVPLFGFVDAVKIKLKAMFSVIKMRCVTKF